MYWDRYIHRDNPRRIEPLDKPLDMYVMLDTETTGLHPEEGATLIGSDNEHHAGRGTGIREQPRL